MRLVLVSPEKIIIEKSLRLVKGELKVRDVRMQEYTNQVRHLQLGFESFSLLHIPRSGNTHADSLATLATSLA